MKRQTLMTAFVLVFPFLMAVGLQFVGVTSANPTLPPSPYPETPDTTPPSIELHLPEPNKAYDPATVSYSITVTKPDSWFENGTIRDTLQSVGYFLDETENFSIAECGPSHLHDFQSETRTIHLEGILPELSEGNHTIQAWAISRAIYHPSDTPQNFYGWWATVAEKTFDTKSDIVTFSVATPTEPDPLPTLLVGCSAATATLAAAGLLVYHKKRPTKTAY
jgi:hypothetical protein